MDKKIKVLWFSINSVQYNSQGDKPISSGGWIESLLRVVSSHNDLDLGIAFLTSDKNAAERKIGEVTYIPMFVGFNKIEQMRNMYTYASYDKKTIEKYLEVVNKFNPDIIHAFGSEWNFGLLKSLVKIPLIIHMQGFWPEYLNSAFPPGWSRREHCWERWYKPTSVIHRMMLEHKSKERAQREEKILSINEYYFGRTRWDKALVRLYNPNAKYYFCSEALRNAFIFEKRKWQYDENARIVNILTTGAGHALKGFDLILKTAKLLKEHACFDYKWYLCGQTSNNMRYFEKKTNIKCNDVNVFPLGLCTAEKIKEMQLQSTLYVHTAYIDNSPNAICEAQYLGLPIISTNVGGIPSLFDDSYPQDMLIATNDPYFLSSKIIEIHDDTEKLENMANLNYSIAHKRHDDEGIYTSLLSAYKEMFNQENKAR